MSCFGDGQALNTVKNFDIGLSGTECGYHV